MVESPNLVPAPPTLSRRSVLAGSAVSVAVHLEATVAAPVVHDIPAATYFVLGYQLVELIRSGQQLLELYPLHV